MLRLRPSELTLTPDDVEETFRRIAQRRALRSPLNASSQPSARHGRPILRRGAQRSTQDAIRALGNIPIFQPQPRQAIFTSVDEDSESRDGQHPDPLRAPPDSVANDTSPAREEQDVSTITPKTSIMRTVCLPLRLEHDRQMPSAQSDRPIASSELIPTLTANDSATAPPRSDSVIGSTRLDTDSVTSSSTTTSENPAELRGGGRAKGKCAGSNAAEASHISSPLRQVRRLSSPRQQVSPGDPVKTPGSTGADLSLSQVEASLKALYLQPAGTAYHLPDSQLRWPQTEPRRRGHRHVTVMRSLSSGSAPSSQLKVQRPNTSGSSSDDVFGILPAPEPPTANVLSRQISLSSSARVHHNSRGSCTVDPQIVRPRHFSSSDASAAFSYYGSLPSGSRQSSSGQSREDVANQAQYDETAGCMRIAPNDSCTARGTEDALLESTSPRKSSLVAPITAPLSPYNVSPLPSVPYTRTADVQSGSAAPASANEEYLDAAAAAIQDLPSPLDDYAEQYHRLVRLGHPRDNMSLQPRSAQSLRQNVESSRPHQGSSSRHQNTVHNLHTVRAMALRRQQLRSAQRSFEHLSEALAHRTHIYGRNSQATRNNQRSSENVPVNMSPSVGQSARESQVQTHRAAFERLHGAVQAMQAVHARSSQTTTPRDVSNQHRAQAPYRPALQDSYLDDTSLNDQRHFVDQTRAVQTHAQAQAQAPASGSSPGAAPRVPPRQGSRHTSGDVPPHTQTRTYRQGPVAAPPALHLRPTRDNPLTSLALDHGSGTTSRRSRSPVMRAPTSARVNRRVPVHQLDQENSGEGEMMLARREQMAINARYNEDEQRDVMDETPPRIGRYERRMLE
jgi:hypothetical protein